MSSSNVSGGTRAQMREARQRERGLPALRAATDRESLLPLLGAVPELLLIILLVVAVVADLGLVVEHFLAVPTLVVGGLGGLVAGLLVIRRATYTHRDGIGAVMMIVLATLLTIPNYVLSSQWLSIERDPGFYTVTAKWLTRHISPFIDGGDAAAFGTLASRTQASGFNPRDGGWEAQSSHLVPALAAMVGRLGDQPLLGAGALIGGASLLALYVAGRHLLGPFWALLPPMALGVGLPFITFTRGIYTEPLTLAFAFLALALAIRGLTSRSRATFAVAGVAAGAALMTRVDGLAVTAPLLGGVALLLAIRGRKDHRESWTQYLLFAVTAVGTSVIGWLELRLNSSRYLSDLHSEFRSLVVVTAAALVGALVLAVVSRTRWWARLVAAPAGRWPLVGALAVIVVMAVLALRPLFWAGHGFSADSGYAVVIESLQAKVGLPLDGTRSYDEQSLHWMSWYLGLPMLIVAVLGLAYLVARSIARGRPATVLTIVLVGSVAVLYLNKVSITPEQIWASRRFLPVVIPGFLLAGTVLLRRWWGVGGLRAGLALVVAASAVALPIQSSLVLYDKPETSGWLDPVQRVCASVTGGRVLLGGPRPYQNVAPTLTAWCNVPVAVLTNDTDLKALRAVDPRPLFVLTGGPQTLADGTTSALFIGFAVVQYEDSLLNLPRTVNTTQMTLYLTSVGTDGGLTAVTPPS